MRHSLIPILCTVMLVLPLGCAEREAPEPADGASATSLPADPPDAPTTNTLVPVGLASGIEACKLLDADDLEAITGQEFAQGQVTASQPDLSRCAWVPESGAAGGISLAIYEPTAEQTWQNYAGREGTTPVDGIGDAALLNLELLDLVVRKGNRVAVIHFARPEDREQIPEWGREIAELLVPEI